MKYQPVSENPLVSVMMPAKNAARYLSTTLQSVQAQTHQHWELIFVDDGSTDDTLAIAQRAAAADTRIQVRAIQHGGRGMARNECLKYMKGELIAICDADDVSVPDRFAAQINYLRSHGDIGAVGSAWMPFSTATPPVSGAVRNDASSPEEIQRAFEQGKMRLHNATVMMRSELITAFGNYRQELRRAQDYEFFARMHRAGVRFDSMAEALLFYRQESNMHSVRYFVESNMYIRYADLLLDGVSKSFEDFSESYVGLRWRMFYRIKYGYYWLKINWALIRGR